MTTELVLGYLVYITPENYARRRSMCETSMTSLVNLRSQLQKTELLVVVNGVNEHSTGVLNYIACNHKKLLLQKNYYDVAVHLSTYFRALQLGAPYFGYLYDDFVFHKASWINETIDFMNSNQSVCAVRIPAFDIKDKNFDANRTSKHQNPDAVRFSATHRSKKLAYEKWSNTKFYTSNFLPNSRPMIWRTSEFTNFLHDKKQVHVMQKFEGQMYDFANKNPNWNCGFINDKVCTTFDVRTSERLHHERTVKNFDNVFVDTEELKLFIENEYA